MKVVVEQCCKLCLSGECCAPLDLNDTRQALHMIICDCFCRSVFCMGGWGALGAQFFSVWFVLVCFFASPVDSNHHEGSNSTVPAHEHKINADEQRVALLSLRQALGDPPQLTGWAEPGPCVGGQPIWVGITACSEDDLVQAMWVNKKWNQ